MRSKHVAAMIAAIAGLGVAAWMGMGPIEQPEIPVPEVAAVAAQHEEPRSGKWPAVERKYRKDHDAEGCAVCGSKIDPQIHHVQPFRLFPEKELDPKNLIWLCGPKHQNHHLTMGHAGLYKGANPHCREDCALLKQRYAESRKIAEEPSK